MHEMKVGHRSELQYIKTKNEMESSLLQKMRDMRNEIMRLKERRPPPTEREMEDHQGRNRNLPLFSYEFLMLAEVTEWK
jgi:hypothetical protein